MPDLRADSQGGVGQPERPVGVPMTPPPVTEADRKLALDFADNFVWWTRIERPERDLLVAQVSRLLSSQREEHCRAVCVNCRDVSFWHPAEFYVTNWYHRMRNTEGAPFRAPCHADPIRSLSLPEPPAIKAYEVRRALGVEYRVEVEPPKPEPR